MDDKRPVSFSTLFTVLKGDKPFFILGTVFTVLSVFILLPLLVVTGTSIKEPYEDYDVKAIEKYGIETTANVTSVETLYNTTINNQHPNVIGYSYYNNGQPHNDLFETLASNKVLPKIKDTIKIKTYNGQSIIENLQPLRFPFYVFYFIPLAFLLPGVCLLLVGLLPALKKLNLYYFIGTTGKRITGRSSTHNLLFIKTKKTNDPIKVFVSDANEYNNCLVPMEEVAKNGWLV